MRLRNKLLWLACLVVAFPLAVHARSICTDLQPTHGCTVNGKANQPCQGTSGNDVILGTAGPDTILAGSGDDVVRGKGGHDVICGGEGHDQLYGDSGDDEISGGKGNDFLSGGDDSDLLLADSGDDELRGGKGDDRLFGGEGNDRLFGDTGKDELLGGKGNDALSGGDEDDTLNGNSGDDQLFGGKGNDVLSGTSGYDQLDGDSGDDILDGGSDTDSLVGGADLDVCMGGEETEGCESDGLPPEEPPPDPSTVSYAMFNNPNDSLLVRAVTPEGTIIEFLGERDEQGMATALTSVHVTSPTEGIAIISLDEQRLPVRALFEDGSALSLVWQSDTTVILKGISADGTEQAIMTVNLASEPTAGALTPLEHGPGQQPGSPLAQTTAVQEFIVDITVTQCGLPVNDAEVNLHIFDPVEPEGESHKAKLAGNGQYFTVIPVGEPDIDPTLCEEITKLIEPVCVFRNNSPVDGFLAGLCNAPLVSKHPLISKLCKATATATKAYCDVGGQNVPGTEMSLGEHACQDGMPEDRFKGLSPVVTLQPFIYVPGTGFFPGERKEASRSGPFPNFIEEVPSSQFAMRSFTTEPEDPAPFQGYQAMVEISCVPPQMPLSISIAGTDGYTDTAPCSTTDGVSLCTLSVPGAEEGVVDTLTVESGGASVGKITITF